ncbi:ehhadh [Symbiodinium sp. CCMP2456]|nr:ehhadh [Symbiodinium sp. CCMP2456]
MFYAENYAGFKKILERVKYYNEQAKVSGSVGWLASVLLLLQRLRMLERFTKNSNYLPIDYFEPSKLLEACAAKEGTKVFPGQTLIDVVLADFRKKSSVPYNSDRFKHQLLAMAIFKKVLATSPGERQPLHFMPMLLTSLVLVAIASGGHDRPIFGLAGRVRQGLDQVNQVSNQVKLVLEMLESETRFKPGNRPCQLGGCELQWSDMQQKPVPQLSSPPSCHILHVQCPLIAKDLSGDHFACQPNLLQSSAIGLQPAREKHALVPAFAQHSSCRPPLPSVQLLGEKWASSPERGVRSINSFETCHSDCVCDRMESAC